MLPFPYKDENPSASNKTVIIALIAANVMVMPFWTSKVFLAYGFIPSNPEPHRWVATLFLHAGMGHLIANMWSLWLFGDNVAARLGRLFLPFYMTAGFAATWMHMSLSPESKTPLIGASGAISGVIGAYLILFPTARLRCIFLLFIKPIFFSMSAAVFGMLFIGWQFLMVRLSENSTGVAYGAHLGGALFGLLVGALHRVFTEEDELQLSGPAGEEPEKEEQADARASIETSISAEKEGAAIRRYVREVRKNPYFELPESSQLWIGDVLSRAGRPHLAKNALEKFILRHPLRPLTAHAHLLLGAVEENFFNDYGSAAQSYTRAQTHRRAKAGTVEEAKSRLESVNKTLAKTFLKEPAPQARYWVLLETAIELSASQWRSVSYILGHPIDAVKRRFFEYPGFVGHDLSMGDASRIAQQLESVGVPVVVLPRTDLFLLPQAHLMTAVQVGDSGLEFQGPEGKAAHVDWSSCLLVAGLGIKSADGVHPVTEVLTLDPGAARPIERFRWTISPERWGPEEVTLEYFTTLQDIVIRSSSVPINRGAQDAFYRRVPSSVTFSSSKSLDAYVSWELHLAHLRKKGY
jgi:membrane associated rhomboid family serine protease